MTDFKEAKTEALKFLRTDNSVGMVATIDSNGQPFLSPVYYAMGSEFDLFFVTAVTTHKARNISINDKVAFSVGSGPEYISVMIRGRASVAKSDEADRAFTILKEKITENKKGDSPLEKMEDLKEQNLIVYKITPERVTFLNINSSQEPKSAGDHLYHLMN
jgi:nitroimidazol reductase NimA-like FMN-containing flavoprotein (pyridoxamine 5'-phosphate oxidase superfamily)